MSLTAKTSVITLDDGTPAFRKAVSGAPAGFLAFEAAGLEKLAELGARVPIIYEVTDDQLILQLVAAAPSASTVIAPEQAFGHELAALHLTGRRAAAPGQPFGALHGDVHGYLGPVPIDLRPASTLHESLVTNRILPLTRMAVERALLPPSALDDARSITPEQLGPVEEPTVVHGDLWAGNRMVDSAGASWLIDPSCHWGHREQDLAMMQLFGDFGPEVFAAYQQSFPLADGWRDRVAVFQLVPLLVHVLAFGTSYAHPTLRVFQTAVSG